MTTYVLNSARVAFYVLFVLLCATAHATDYTSLDITRDQVMRMLTEEGLDPTINQYPPVDGEPYNEVMVWNPHINIGMYGPDDGLTTIALNLQPSADEGEAHLQALVSSKLLAAALPNWDGREEWFNRTIVGMADGSIKGGVSFQRDGRLIEAAMESAHQHRHVWA